MIKDGSFRIQSFDPPLHRRVFAENVHELVGKLLGVVWSGNVECSFEAGTVSREVLFGWCNNRVVELTTEQVVTRHGKAVIGVGVEPANEFSVLLISQVHSKRPRYASKFERWSKLEGAEVFGFSTALGVKSDEIMRLTRRLE